MVRYWLGSFELVQEDDDQLVGRGVVESVKVVDGWGHIQLRGVNSVFVVAQGNVAHALFKPNTEVQVAFAVQELPESDLARNRIHCRLSQVPRGRPAF